MFSCNIDEHLSEHGLHHTRDRRRILELFHDERTWTAAQIHKELSDLDLSTVYRNLQKLSDSGLLNAVYLHNGEQHYEHARDDHHAHLNCESCGVTRCVPCPITNPQKHHLELIGRCETCS